MFYLMELWVILQPMVKYFSFLILPSYIIYRLVGMEILLILYFAHWPALSSYFAFCHGMKFFSQNIPMELLPYAMISVPLATLPLVLILYRCRFYFHNIYTVWVAGLSNVLYGFWALHDWYHAFLRKLPKNPVAEKVIAVFWREDWALLVYKTVPLLVGVITVLSLIYVHFARYRDKVWRPRREKRQKVLFEQLQKQFGSSDQQLAPVQDNKESVVLSSKGALMTAAG